MKVFFLLSRIPWPLEKGDKLRAFHQIKSLSKHHQIILCALNTNPKVDKQAAFKALQPYCHSINFIDLPPQIIMLNLIKALFNGKPFQTGYFYSKKAQRQIDRLIQRHQPDVAFCQLIRVAQYLEAASLPKVIDYQDILSAGMKRRADIARTPFKWLYRLEYLRLLRYEAMVFDKFHLHTIISYADRDLIPHPRRQEVLVIPNGVDQEFFRPKQAEKKFDLVFTGNMAYPPNINAAEFLVCEIMPLVWAKRPQTSVLLAGANPDRKVKALHSQKVHVSGWLDDIRDAYNQARVFIAPMRIGTGLQNKLLEAMSMQLPCITTTLAQQALGGKPGQDLLVANRADELAEAVLQLLDNEDLANKIAQAGNRYVAENYHWDSATEKLSQAMYNLVRQKV